MKKLSVLTLIILSALFYAFPYFNTVSAQNNSISTYPQQNLQPEKPNYNPQNLDMGTNPGVPQNLSTYTQSVFIEITSAASCLLSGVDAIRPDQQCLGFDPQTKKIGYVENNGGAIGLMGGMIAFTFNVPASSGEYVRYMAGNFGISQKAVAQGTQESRGGSGFESLRPLLSIWTTMRNLVYILFVIIFIILGLGIMFRIQIDPRAVLSIQSQLPKIVIALILVTFSYAIAGFLVDMMYLSLYLIINLFQAQGLDTATNLATNPINAAGGLGGGGIGGIAFDASKGIAGAMTSLFDGTIGSIFKTVINTVFGAILGAGIGTAVPIPGVGTILGGVVGGILGGFTGSIPGVGEPFTLVVGAIAWVIIVIALLSALFRLWFTLLKTYVMILINITFAPIMIAFGLFPGSSFSFGNWIRSLAADLAAFPLVLILFSLGKTLQDSFSKSGPNSFVPPYVGDPGDMSVFASIIGMGMILLAPEAVNMTKSIFKAPEQKLTSGAGRALGVGQGILSKGVGGVTKSLWYTNPHTGESGRLKALAGEKASNFIDNSPTKIAGALRKTRDRFSTESQRQRRNDRASGRESQRQTQEERRNQANLANPIPNPQPQGGANPPEGEAPGPENPDGNPQA